MIQNYYLISGKGRYNCIKKYVLLLLNKEYFCLYL